MQFIGTPYGVRADDESTIVVSSQTAPVVLSAVRVGHVCFETTQTTLLQTALLIHHRTVHCGIRGHSHLGNRAGWSSNTVYSVYTYRGQGWSEPRAVITSVNGLGPRLFIVDQLNSGATFMALATTLDEPTLWDVCCAVVGTCDEAFKQGRRQMHREMCQAFVDGRVTRRKGPRGVTVKVKPLPPVWCERPNGTRETVLDLTDPIPGMNPANGAPGSDTPPELPPSECAGA